MGYSPTVSALPTRLQRAFLHDHLVATITITGGVGAGLVAAYVASMQDPLLAVLIAGGLALSLLSLRWPLASLYVFVALVPIEEIVTIGGLGTLSRWTGIAFAVVWVGSRLGRIMPGALPLAGWVYGGWALLSVTWAHDPNVTLGQIQTLIQLVVIGFLIADVVIDNPAVIRPLLWVYSVSAGATAVVGILLYLVGGSEGGGRLAALANQNPAQFATILLPAMIFTLYQVLEGRRVAIGVLVTAACMGAIALSGTRSVWLAATVVIFLLVIPRLGIRRAILALVVLCLLALVTVQIPGVANLVADRTETAASTGGAGRTEIWSVGLQIIASSPLIGVGYANFPVAFTPSALRAANVSEAIGTAAAPHNIVIGTTGELGVVGLVLLALLLGPLLLRRGWGPDASVLQAMLVSLMINALFIDIVSNRKQVWVVIGMAAGLAYLARRQERRTESGTQPSSPPAIVAQPPSPAVVTPAPTPRRAPAGRGVGSGAGG